MSMQECTVRSAMTTMFLVDCCNHRESNAVPLHRREIDDGAHVFVAWENGFEDFGSAKGHRGMQNGNHVFVRR
jgi:hypothetical protein